jgi:[ribosomal protein S5]-alanine N-acetyltransferase
MSKVIPFIEGKQIYLRQLVQTDLENDYPTWFNDEEVCAHNSHHRFPMMLKDMQNYFDNEVSSRDNLILAICDKESDKHVGNVSIMGIDSFNQSGEFAIILGDRNFWGKGIGQEAARLIIDHAFKQLNLKRIYCGTLDTNKGMQKLADKLGFTKEGQSRQSQFKNGKFHDTLEYGILKDEWNN